MVQVNELKAAMARKGITQSRLASQLNISQKTLYNKFQRGVFVSTEMEKMVEILDLSDPASVFFAPNVT